MRILISFLLAISLFLTAAFPVHAEGQVLGIHILNPGELEAASKLLEAENSDQWRYVTIPLSLNDLEKQAEWQSFLNQAERLKIHPIVRLTTKFENGAWQVPTRKNVVDLIHFLSQLDWSSNDRLIIAFNEVNHAPEWGGRINPAEYVEMLRFTSDWARTEQKNYKILPAAMDLAAPNGSATKEAFQYLREMFAADPSWTDTIDYWNSHSYPNPAFSASARATGKTSIRGYQNELDFLKENNSRDFQVFITETGWVESRQTRSKLADNYAYAVERVWAADDRVIAVTPFVLQGAPGPFANFSFLDSQGKPTLQYQAYRKALERIKGKSQPALN